VPVDIQVGAEGCLNVTMRLAPDQSVSDINVLQEGSALRIVVHGSCEEDVLIQGDRFDYGQAHAKAWVKQRLVTVTIPRLATDAIG
jgi:hypothetical protein